jgi:methyl-accepting chemotaxis protein
MNMNFQKRRIYFIDKKFQTKYALLTALLLLTYTFLFIVIIFAPYMLTLYFDYPMAEKEEAARAILVLHGTIWPWVAGVIIFFGVFSIFVTHKIAGPLYRLKKSLDEIAAGNLNVKIKLRKKDELKDLAEHINVLVEELRTFITTLKNNYDILSDYIAELENQISTKAISQESGMKLLAKVQESKKNIEAVLEKFNIQN